MKRWNYRQSGTGTGHINDVPRSARPWPLRLQKTAPDNSYHLGSVRAVVNETGDETESNFYYPFGAQYFISSSEKEIQRNRFNGKEFDHFHGLNEYDYGARWYDPILARFTTVDPLCEKYYSISPYAYCANNPVNAVDPDGKTIRISGDGS